MTDKRKLQRLIDAAARAHTAAFEATYALNNYSVEVYGCAPSDVDADQIIDAVLGGGGSAQGMTADEFDAEMRQLAPAPQPGGK